MGKTGRWIRNFFTGKRDTNNREASIASPINFGGGRGDPRPKEKRRWSFRRPSSRPETDPTLGKRHALAVATAAAADAAVAAAKAAAVVIQLTAAASGRAEEAAAIKIQCVFRGYLARKALNALRGLVKLQALVRGHLVRKQATATLRCMQALITVQARARAHRIRMAAEAKSLDHNPENQPKYVNFDLSNLGSKRLEDYDKGIEENIKIVEMDLGNSYKPATKARNSYSNQISSHRSSIRQEKISPVPSAIADSSPRTCSNHFDECSFGTAQCYSATSKPDLTRTPFSYARSEYGESAYDEFPFFPNYMANTESSRAKVRSHSAPKSRPADAFDRQSSRRGHSGEGRNVPRGVRMQISSSQVSSTGQNFQFPKLDKSINESECGSTSTYRSAFGYEVQGHRF